MIYVSYMMARDGVGAEHSAKFKFFNHFCTRSGADKMRGLQVTLLVAAEGDYSLPGIYDNNDLKEALKKLGSIPADNVQVGFQGSASGLIIMFDFVSWVLCIITY